MTNHPGDYYSFLQLAQRRAEHLERQSEYRQLVQEAPYRAGLRAFTTRLLRTRAHRVDRSPTAPDTAPEVRYQRAP